MPRYVAVSLFVQLFSYELFVQVLFVRYFSYRYFSYELFVQIQKGGGKVTRQGGEKSSPKEQFMRGYTAPYARTFAPSPLYLYEKYLYEKFVRKVAYENNCTKSDTAAFLCVWITRVLHIIKFCTARVILDQPNITITACLATNYFICINNSFNHYK